MPLGNIVNDAARFRHLVKGHLRENLKKYLSEEDLIGKQGKDRIRLPVPIITIPRFRYGPNFGGVAQGDGEVGDVINPTGRKGEGSEGSNGPDEGDLINLEMPMSDLEDLLLEELKLPYLEPKGNQTIHTQKPIYKSIAEHGVQRNFKRTYKEALKRMAASGGYRPGDAVVPINKDFRYRAASAQPKLQSNAVLIYMLDVSTSVDTEKRRLCRLTNSWIQRVMGRYYPNVEERFIVHTTNAYEVEGSVFYGTKLGGGTHISSAFTKCAEIIQKDYPPQEWNIYLFYYSDGDNFKDDNNTALTLLEDMLLPNRRLPTVNMFCYGECSEGKDLFMSKLKRAFYLSTDKGNSILKRKTRPAKLLDDDTIFPTLKIFLNKHQIPFYQAGEYIQSTDKT